ncbi:MAG: sugar ABC transporter substrate-binding protein [Clostridiales Family XIII bacterium]|jgi:ribose transport system substrate-binding protein|nr:sugar ABC transporter substrate-binding protein [Clostridiales Family XIII bacterium]
MKKGRIVFSILLAIVMVVSFAACSSGGGSSSDAAQAGSSAAAPADDAAAEGGNGGYTIGRIAYQMGHAYHVADCKFFEEYANADGNEVIFYDGNADGQTMLEQAEDLISKGVDGVVMQPADQGVANTLVQNLQDAGIPVVTFVNKPTEPSITNPHVELNEYPAAFEMGQLAATKWKEWYPDKPIKVGIFDLPSVQQVHEQRAMAFMDGILDIDPEAELVSILDGGGDTEKSYAAAQDMLQSHPEVNIVFGINATSCLGALAAFEEVGRGTATDAIPDTELFASCDGTDAEGMKIFNPNSSLKMTMGLVPSTFARTQYDTLMDILTGKIEMTDDVSVPVTDGLFDYWSNTLDEYEEWLVDEYGMEPGYADNVRKELGIE